MFRLLLLFTCWKCRSRSCPHYFVLCLLMILLSSGTAVTNVNKTDVELDIEACYDAMINPMHFVHPDKHLKAPDIIKRHGFPCEVHQITSPDGYILELHRIPPKNPPEPGSPPKLPVLIQHGIMASSVNWILPPAHQALAYRVSELGYDVWLGNVRGSSYSLDHLKFDHTTMKYWEFSWHEMGFYDIPTIIDHILASTNNTKLTYIGHSMGCTMFFVCMSMHPEYNEKIDMMYALAPVAYTGHASSFFKFFAPFSYNFQAFYSVFGWGKLVPEIVRKINNPLFASSCNLSPYINCNICSPLYFLLFNSDGRQMNYTMLPTITQHFPDRVSSRTITHYGQNLVTNEFQQYDDRFALPNWIRRFLPWKKGDPPKKYDLKKITVPIVLFYADRDNLADPKDVSRLILELPNVRAAVKVCYPLFNHNDFLFGMDVNELVYDKLLSILQGNWDVDLNFKLEYINARQKHIPKNEKNQTSTSTEPET